MESGERIVKKLLMVLLSAFLLIGCESSVNEPVVYKTITQKEAEDKIKNDNAVLIDVRTESEYNEGNIDGSINVPVDEIETISYDKDKIIIVYCRSGNRSKTAAHTLIENGYTNVYDFGAFENWIVK